MSTEAENARSLRSESGRPGVACESFSLAHSVLPPTPVQERMATICELGGTYLHSCSVSPPCILAGFASQRLRISAVRAAYHVPSPCWMRDQETASSFARTEPSSQAHQGEFPRTRSVFE